MNDLKETALQDARRRKVELAVELDRLRVELAEAKALAAKWEATACQIHDERMTLAASMEASRKGLESMTLWAHLRMWWAR